MQHYYLKNEMKEKIIGEVYPQCKGLPTGLGLTFKWFDKPNSMTNLSNEDFPDFEPQLIFELEEKAMLTDVVSPSNISAKGFLINDKVKKLLSDFALMEHKYFPATLIFKGEKLKYYWLHFREKGEQFFNYINLDKTTFYIGNLARWKEANIKIDNLQDYYETKQTIGFKTLNFEELHTTEAFKTNALDLFYLDSFHNDFIITEKLKKRLQDLDITGLAVKKLSFLIL